MTDSVDRQTPEQPTPAADHVLRPPLCLLSSPPSPTPCHPRYLKSVWRNFMTDRERRGWVSFNSVQVGSCWCRWQRECQRGSTSFAGLNALSPSLRGQLHVFPPAPHAPPHTPPYPSPRPSPIPLRPLHLPFITSVPARQVGQPHLARHAAPSARLLRERLQLHEPGPGHPCMPAVSAHQGRWPCVPKREGGGGGAG